MKDLICPHCAAPLTGRVCEYCGCETGVEIVSPEECDDMKRDPAFETVLNYCSDMKYLYPGEEGRFYGARIVVDCDKRPPPEIAEKMCEEEQGAKKRKRFMFWR